MEEYAAPVSLCEPINNRVICHLSFVIWNSEPGTWNLEPGTWNLEPGTWNLEPGTPPTLLQQIAPHSKIRPLSMGDLAPTLVTADNLTVQALANRLLETD